jgi:hypothetical protein
MRRSSPARKPAGASCFVHKDGALRLFTTERAQGPSLQFSGRNRTDLINGRAGEELSADWHSDSKGGTCHSRSKRRNAAVNETTTLPKTRPTHPVSHEHRRANLATRGTAYHLFCWIAAFSTSALSGRTVRRSAALASPPPPRQPPAEACHPVEFPGHALSTSHSGASSEEATRESRGPSSDRTPGPPPVDDTWVIPEGIKWLAGYSSSAAKVEAKTTAGTAQSEGLSQGLS